jgi:hypothetical protein
MSQRSSRKRSAFEAIIDGDEDNMDMAGGESKTQRGSSSSSSARAPTATGLLNFDLAAKFDKRRSVFKVNPKEEGNFSKVAKDAQEQLVKGVVRLFVMKGIYVGWYVLYAPHLYLDPVLPINLYY